MRNAAFDSSPPEYDSSYHNEKKYSAAFQTRLMWVADLGERFLGITRHVEVGCGKCCFLELLTARGSRITAFDSTYYGNSQHNRTPLAEPSVSLAAEGVIFRHVLEHLLDPVAFLNHIGNAQVGRERISIEVPYFDLICRNRAWQDVSYKHVH